MVIKTYIPNNFASTAQIFGPIDYISKLAVSTGRIYYSYEGRNITKDKFTEPRLYCTLGETNALGETKTDCLSELLRDYETDTCRHSILC